MATLDLFGATLCLRLPALAYAVCGEDDLIPVYCGNEVTPTKAAQAQGGDHEAEELLVDVATQSTGWHLLEPDAEVPFGC